MIAFLMIDIGDLQAESWMHRIADAVSAPAGAAVARSRRALEAEGARQQEDWPGSLVRLRPRRGPRFAAHAENPGAGRHEVGDRRRPKLLHGRRDGDHVAHVGAWAAAAGTGRKTRV